MEPLHSGRRTVLQSFGLGALGALLTGRSVLAAPTPQNQQKKEFGFASRPILQDVRSDSAMVTILTNRPAVCRVELKGSDGKTKSFAAQEHGLVQANQTHHSITISGLKPGQSYEYVVIAKEITQFQAYRVRFGKTKQTAKHSFTTPKASADTIRFGVLNDIHKRRDLVDSLLTQVDAKSCDGIFLNGDILSHINGEHDVAYMLSTKSAIPSQLPFRWIRGNHECRGPFARMLDKYIYRPDGQYYYTFRQGPVQFLILDCGEDKADKHPAYFGLADYDAFRREQTEWLKGVLASKDWQAAPFRIALCHIPIRRWTKGPDYMRSKPFQHTWQAMLEAAGLDLMISAHTHQFEYAAANSRTEKYPVLIGGAPKPGQATLMDITVDSKAIAVTVTNDAKKKLGEYTFARKK